MRSFPFVLLLSFYATLTSAGDTPKGKVRGCYLSDYGGRLYQPDYEQWTLSKYVPGLCTHIFYSMARSSADGSFIYARERADQSEGYKQLHALKAKQPDLKILLSFEIDQPEMAKAKESREKFAKNAVNFAKSYRFDGIDIDWQTATPREKSSFTELIRAVRINAGYDFIVSAVFSPNIERASAIYDLKAVSALLDFINLRTEDQTISESKRTVSHSPIFAAENSIEKTLNLFTKSVPRQKILLGIHALGRGFTLASNSPNQGIGAPVVSPSNAVVVYTGHGRITQNQACKIIASGVEPQWDRDASTPYIQKGDQWYSYEDKRSVMYKAIHAFQQQLGGVVVWNLDYDDYEGTCKNGKFPLMTAIQKRFSVES